jgi:hypothetical protein
MEFWLALARCFTCYIVWFFTGVVYIHYKRMNSKIKGWLLFQLVR